MADPKDIFKSILEKGARAIAPDVPVEIHIERPKNPEHGDLSTNVALQLSRQLGRKPREVAQDLLNATLPALLSSGVTTQEGVSIAGPGFYNIHVNPAFKLQSIKQALEEGKSFGRAKGTAGEKIQVEFVSANPTGPLHVGHGRQGALGDAIAALLESQGHSVTREFYYNDAGGQIEKLAQSVQARAKGIKPGEPGWPAEGYAGEYIEDISRDFLNGKHSPENLEAIRKFAVAYLRREQDADLQAFGVRFDNYYLESSLYSEGKVEQVVRTWEKNGKTYEHEGALWLRTTEYGDDKDRVARKSDGGYTYFVPDVAYHVTKWQRGFRKVINVQGTDHHSTVMRVRAGLQALGIGVPKDYPDYVLHSLVKVMRGGEEVKISKRAGSYVTVRDLIDWVGRDAVRFFLVSRKADSDFVFDVDLAREKTLENPVYYVQYAHARVCSVFAQLKEDFVVALAGMDVSSLGTLTGEKELRLAGKLQEYPDAIAEAAKDFAPHSVAFYLRELAAEFHSYYNAERILVDDEALRAARLALCAAVRQTLANGLSLLGVSAPEKM
jgi:arginyl-tRNA synthetase